MSQIHKYSELVYGKKLDKATIEEFLDVDYRKATQRWVKSRYKDFSIYDKPLYLSTLITSYFHLSNGSTRNAIAYLKKLYPDRWEKLKVFDDYNGLGLTTRDLVKAGFNKAWFYNSCQLQRDLFRKITLDDGFPDRKFVEDADRSGKYDVVLSFEVIEHYQKPEEYLDTVLKMVKKDGLFIYSMGFRDMHTGHFPEYEIGGQMVSMRKAGRSIKTLLEDRGFENMNIKCWNGKPTFYRKK